MVTELSAVGTPKLSGSFAYALAALLRPYAVKDEEKAAMRDVILCEVEHVIRQQGSDLKAQEKETLLELCRRYLDEKETTPRDFLNLFLAETFINRVKGEM